MCLNINLCRNYGTFSFMVFLLRNKFQAVHLTHGEAINFEGVMKTAVCVYQSNIELEEWMQQLPLDVQVTKK